MAYLAVGEVAASVFGTLDTKESCGNTLYNLPKAQRTLILIV